MSRLHTLRDLFRHFDWSGRHVLDATSKLSDEHLDREFPMGFGTLRKTLWHIYGAEHAWFQRIHGEQPLRFAPEADRPALPILEEKLTQTRERRQRFLDGLSEAELNRDIRYTDMKGNPHASKLGHILLHVCNHGIHHHVQALNMLRHAGVKPPQLDYIMMYYEKPDSPAPVLSVELLRDFFAYNDWGRNRVMKLILDLDDESLDRSFEMGMGSIRKNMVHTHGAEAWWLNNWLGPNENPFPKSDERVSLLDLQIRFDQTAAQRNEFLSKKPDDDLLKPVEARLPDGRVLVFPLGVTAMQLCYHGTHHRAQTINMLRQCGKTTEPTDYIVMKREMKA